MKSKRKRQKTDKYLSWIIPENISGKIKLQSIPTLEAKNYFKEYKPYELDGDQPKDGIRIYKYDKEKNGLRKKNPLTWELFIAKGAEKYYPSESLTEKLMNRIGEFLGMEMAESDLCMCASLKNQGVVAYQLRFLSRYFLDLNKEELVHGARIIESGLRIDSNEVDSWEKKNITAKHLTVSMVIASIKSLYGENSIQLIKQFQLLLLFDAFIGNHDRHHYNWGVIRNLSEKENVRFAPIYDTARGLFWNTIDEKLSNILKSNTQGRIKKYCELSKPKLCWTQNKEVNHFDLVRNLYSSNQGLTKIRANAPNKINNL